MIKRDELTFILDKNFGKRTKYIDKIKDHFYKVEKIYIDTCKEVFKNRVLANVSTSINTSFGRSEVLKNIQKIQSGLKSNVVAGIIYVEKFLGALKDAKSNDDSENLDLSLLNNTKIHFMKYVNSFNFPFKFSYELVKKVVVESEESLEEIDREHTKIIHYLIENFQTFKSAVSITGFDILSQLNFNANKYVALKDCYVEEEYFRGKEFDVSKVIDALEQYRFNAVDILSDGSPEFVLAYLEALNVLSIYFGGKEDTESIVNRLFYELNFIINENLELYFDKIDQLSQEFDYFDMYVKTFNIDLNHKVEEIYTELAPKK